MPIEQKLYDKQRKREARVSQMRKQLREKEMQELRDKPMLSPGTQRIARHLKIKDPMLRQEHFVRRKQLGIERERRVAD